MYGTLMLYKEDFSTKSKIVQIIGITFFSLFSFIAFSNLALISKSFSNIGLLQTNVINPIQRPQFLDILFSSTNNFSLLITNSIS